MIAKVFSNAFREAIKSARSFDYATSFIGAHSACYTLENRNPKILEIVRHTSLSYHEAEQVSVLSQDHSGPLDSLISVACQLGGNQRAGNLIKESLKHEPRRP